MRFYSYLRFQTRQALSEHGAYVHGDGNTQWVYQFQLQETEDPTKSGLNDKGNLLCHISRTFNRSRVV